MHAATSFRDLALALLAGGSTGGGSAPGGTSAAAAGVPTRAGLVQLLVDTRYLAEVLTHLRADRGPFLLAQRSFSPH